VPFKAIVPAITWIDLARALAPANVPKGGLVGRLAQLIPGTWDPSITQARDDLLGGSVPPAVKAAAAPRSSRSSHARPDGMPAAGVVLHPDIMGIRPLFETGRGPFRWTCLSGEPADLMARQP